MNSNKKTARIAGLLYLLVIIFGIFSELYVRSNLIVQGDATATTSNIIASEQLFRVGFVSDLIMITSFLLLPLVLYLLLQSVNKNLASLMVIFVLVSVPIMFINMLVHFAPLLLMSGADYLTVFETDQLQALVLFFLDLYTTGVMIATIFHGLWLLPLGYLVYKSGYFPRVLGILLMMACFGFLIESLQYFLFPDYKAITYPGSVIAVIAEFSFCLWLLIKGVKGQNIMTENN